MRSLLLIALTLATADANCTHSLDPSTQVYCSEQSFEDTQVGSSTTDCTYVIAGQSFSYTAGGVTSTQPWHQMEQDTNGRMCIKLTCPAGGSPGEKPFVRDSTGCSQTSHTGADCAGKDESTCTSMEPCTWEPNTGSGTCTHRSKCPYGAEYDSNGNYVGPKTIHFGAYIDGDGSQHPTCARGRCQNDPINSGGSGAPPSVIVWNTDNCPAQCMASDAPVTNGNINLRETGAGRPGTTCERCDCYQTVNGEAKKNCRADMSYDCKTNGVPISGCADYLKGQAQCHYARAPCSVVPAGFKAYNEPNKDGYQCVHITCPQGGGVLKRDTHACANAGSSGGTNTARYCEVTGGGKYYYGEQVHGVGIAAGCTGIVTDKVNVSHTVHGATCSDTVTTIMWDNANCGTSSGSGGTSGGVETTCRGFDNNPVNLGVTIPHPSQTCKVCDCFRDQMGDPTLVCRDDFSCDGNKNADCSNHLVGKNVCHFVHATCEEVEVGYVALNTPDANGLHCVDVSCQQQGNSFVMVENDAKCQSGPPGATKTPCQWGSTTVQFGVQISGTGGVTSNDCAKGTCTWDTTVQHSGASAPWGTTMVWDFSGCHGGNFNKCRNPGNNAAVAIGQEVVGGTCQLCKCDKDSAPGMTCRPDPSCTINSAPGASGKGASNAAAQASGSGDGAEGGGGGLATVGIVVGVLAATAVLAAGFFVCQRIEKK